MSLGLTNARIGAGGGSRPRIQKVAPARTSIAEDAKFIPKPHKRVSFKVNTQFKVMGGNGSLVSKGQLGKYGLTAQLNTAAYHGKPALVAMEIDYTPEKDFTVIATQEEGRQTNRAAYTHYTQQYDAYGRPIIGFSREPYDFAAMKYIVVSAQIKFQDNMARTQEIYKDEYAPTLAGDVYNLTLQEQKYLGERPAPSRDMIESDPVNLNLPGSGETDAAGTTESAEPGYKPVIGTGKGKAAAVETTGKSAIEVAEMMGMKFSETFKSADIETIANLHELKDSEGPAAVAVSV